MAGSTGRDNEYCVAVDKIKQIVARYRPDVTVLKGPAILSPRILMLMVERSEKEIPPEIMHRLRPLAEAVLNRSELGIAEMVGAEVPEDLQSKIQSAAMDAYRALADLHDHVMIGPSGAV